MTDKTVTLKYEPGSSRNKWILTYGPDRIAAFTDGPLQRRLAYTTAERLAKIQMEDSIEIEGPEDMVDRLRTANGLYKGWRSKRYPAP